MDSSVVLVMSLIVVSFGMFGMCEVFKNKMVESVFISSMLVYLVSKKSVNGFFVYFMLKLDISLDFFFVSLNGVWFVLVSVEMYYIVVKG